MQWLNLPDDLTRHLGNIQYIQYIYIYRYMYKVSIHSSNAFLPCLSQTQESLNSCRMPFSVSGHQSSGFHLKVLSANFSKVNFAIASKNLSCSCSTPKSVPWETVLSPSIYRIQTLPTKSGILNVSRLAFAPIGKPTVPVHSRTRTCPTCTWIHGFQPPTSPGKTRHHVDRFDQPRHFETKLHGRRRRS